VQQRDPPTWSYQVYGYAVGDGYGKKNPGDRRNPAIDPLDLNPAPAGVDAHDFDAVHLVAKHDRLELRQLTTKGEPARHHVSHGLPAPETEVEATAGIGTPAGNSRDYPVLFSPAGDFESRYRT